MRTIRSTTQLLVVAGLMGTAPSLAQQGDPGFASIDIGGRSLRYKCIGNGTPTVLIEPGGAVSVETVMSWDKPIGWAVIVPQVGKLTRVCVYDRAGLGRSDPAPVLPRTSLDVARDLHELVERAHIAPPYVFAGQSFGGMNARMFASLYPQTIAGMVLVDSSHPDTYPEMARVLPPPTPGESQFLTGWRNGPDLSKSREWIDLKANGDLVRATGGIGNKPLIVLAQSPDWNDPFAPDDVEPLIDGVHQRLDRQLITLSSNSRLIVAKTAGHNIQAEDPQLVIDAIRDVVAQARKNSATGASR